MDWVSNVAMLELVVTLFVGLLLKMDMIDAEAAESELFTAMVVLLSTFIFFYPMISLLVGSDRAHNAVVSVFTKLRAKVFAWKKKHNTIAVVEQDVDTNNNTNGGSSETPKPGDQRDVAVTHAVTFSNNTDANKLGDLSPARTNNYTQVLDI